MRAPSMSEAPPFDTVVDCLRYWAEHEHEASACVFLRGDADGSADSLSFADLDRRAREIAATLQAKVEPGDRVLLTLSSNRNMVQEFYGCLYAGTIPVLCPMPQPNRPQGLVAGIVRDCAPAALIATAEAIPLLRRRLADALPDDAVHWIPADTLGEADGQDWEPPALTRNSISHLQYTSGSTSRPRGVMISHGNLIHNAAVLSKAFEWTRQTVPVSWLPLHHDMGLVGFLVGPLCYGLTTHLIPPLDFVQSPICWLRAISDYRGTYTSAPNFAYDLAVRRISDDQRRELDLSSWISAANGSEPVRPETIVRFTEAFAPCGLRPEAMFPCYGLAEATLIVSGGPNKEQPVILSVNREALADGIIKPVEPHSEGSTEIASSGQALAGQNPRVVDPSSGKRLGDLELGEIWVGGASVAAGYWQKPLENRESFGARIPGDPLGYLRTGDLGFLRNGQLFVTGRLKDLIIVQGRNHYPQDIEITVEDSDPALRPDCGAAFSIDEDGEERLVVVQEVKRSAIGKLDPVEVTDRARQAVAERHGITLRELVLIRTGTLPKTSSGKPRRQACRQAYIDKKYHHL